MTISARDRKLLWSRAHDACAICRTPLTSAAESPRLAGLVLGEEAHIVAQREDGPRGHDADRSNIDGFENLLLLCAADHKRVDEQPDIYTVDRLQQIKREHEKWAADRWASDHADDPMVTIKARGEDAVPMDPVLTGQQVWNLVSDSSMYYMRTVEGDVDSESAQIADDFLTAARDWGDIAEDVQDQGFAAIRQAQDSLQEMLLELWEHGLFVYGRRVMRTIKGGILPPSPWPTTHLVVMTAEELKDRLRREGAP